MANPRRITLQLQSQPLSDPDPPPPPPVPPSPAAVVAALSSASVFLKRPSAFPFLLSVFVLLTWLFLRLEHPTSASSQLRSSISSGASASSRSEDRSRGGGSGGGNDAEANLVRFSSVKFPSPIARDGRGWLLDPVAAARKAGIHGGASECTSVHVGEIQPGGLRGNHRHNTCNETFIIWGADTKFRLENANVKDRGYGEVTIGFDEVAIAASPSGTAHALINIDHVRPTFFLGCQDSIVNNSSTTDYKVWKDL